jgi:ribosome-binding protein aMBF1 (putative translation factor)
MSNHCAGRFFKTEEEDEEENRQPQFRRRVEGIEPPDEHHKRQDERHVVEAAPTFVVSEREHPGVEQRDVAEQSRLIVLSGRK